MPSSTDRVIMRDVERERAYIPYSNQVESAQSAPLLRCLIVTYRGKAKMYESDVQGWSAYNRRNFGELLGCSYSCSSVGRLARQTKRIVLRRCRLTSSFLNMEMVLDHSSVIVD